MTKRLKKAAALDPRLVKDFRLFLYVIWKHLGLPDPTPVQYQIAEYLQHGPKRKIIEGFRGVGKSWITSAYVLWRLYCDPQWKFMVVSASKVRADDFSTFTLRLIKEVPMLKHLIPNGDQRESKVSFDVGPAKAAHAASVTSKGITSQLSGGRAHEIIADDIEVPNNSVTQELREKLLKAVTEFEAIIMPDIGRITYLGTPQTEESAYNKLRHKGYVIRIWPARYPKPEDVIKYGGGLAPVLEDALEKDPTLAGTPTDPQRFNDLDLIEREASYGRSGFALQFMLDTTLSDAEKYPLKLGDLIVGNFGHEQAPVSVQYGSGKDQLIDSLESVGFAGDRYYRPLHIDDKWAPYEGKILVIDPSGRGADELAYAVMAQLHGKIFLLKAGGIKGDGYSEETLNTLAKIAKQFEVNTCLIESNFGDGAFAKVFAPVLAKERQVAIEEVRQHMQKEKRIIETLEPVMNSHRLLVDEDVIKEDLKQSKDSESSTVYSLFYQMTRLTKERGALKHDDRIDCIEMGVRFFIDSMARDEDKAKDDWKEKALEKELEVFMNNLVIGATNPTGETWIN